MPMPARNNGRTYSTLVDQLPGIPDVKDVSLLSYPDRVGEALLHYWTVQVSNHNSVVRPFMRAVWVRPEPGVLSDNCKQQNVRQMVDPQHELLQGMLEQCECNYAITAHYDLFLLLLEDGAPINLTMFKLATSCTVMWQGVFDFNNWFAMQDGVRTRKEFQDAGLLR